MDKVKYPDVFINKVICGNNMVALKRMPDNCIDTILTDPPYGLSFMGKKWDYDVPSIEFWKECLRVLKPGGTMLAFAGSRTQHRMACNIEDAGFILKDCLMWLYCTGFPKAIDIARQIDKIHGNKPAKNVIRHDNGAMNGSNYTRNKNGLKSENAKQWDGWKGHGLKPAYEPIIVAMKANDGSYAENALKHGVSGLNIKGGTVGNGSFPANVLLDSGAAEILNIQGGDARIFYTAKTSVSERNKGCEDLEDKDGNIPSGAAGMHGKTAKKKNFHPTVKPVELMVYLCQLTNTPTGGIVLDPFIGSGTTGMACRMLGRKFIGFERNKEYAEIARHRIKTVKVNGLKGIIGAEACNNLTYKKQSHVRKNVKLNANGLGGWFNND